MFLLWFLIAILLLAGEVVIFVRITSHAPPAQAWCADPDTGKQEAPILGDDC